MTSVALLVPGIDRLAGAERQVLLLAKGLQQRGWRVTVIALSGSIGEAGPALIAAGVGFLTLGMRKGLADPRGWARLRRWLRHNRPDIVHAHLPHASWIARLSRLLAPVRVQLDTVHTAALGSPIQRRIYRWTRALPDCVTFVSADARQAHEAAGSVLPARAIVLPNGIDTDEWSRLDSAPAELRSQIGPPEAFLWLAAGRLEPVKNYPLLLDAFARLPSNAHIAVGGSGSQEYELRSLSQKLGVAHRVKFLGFRSDIRSCMQAADAFVLSSHCEGLPMSLLESGSCGLPCVATDVPGTREVVAPGVTGILASPADEKSLAAAMLSMMQLPGGERRYMGMNARQRVLERFQLGVVLDTWEGLYKELLERNKHPRRWAVTV